MITICLNATNKNHQFQHSVNDHHYSEGEAMAIERRHLSKPKFSYYKNA